MIKTKTVPGTNPNSPELLSIDDLAECLDKHVANWIEEHPGVHIISIDHQQSTAVSTSGSRFKTTLTYFSAMIVYREVEPITIDSIVATIKTMELFAERIREGLNDHA